MEAVGMTPEFETLKARLRATWIAGDFGQIAKSTASGAVSEPRAVATGSAARFQQLFGNRTDVQTEVARFVSITQTAWRKINHYYRARNQLIHQRSSVSISDSEIADFRKTVERVLSKLFGLKF